MAAQDGWPSARFGGCTEPGLQAGSPAACVLHQADPAAIMTSVPGAGIINGAQILDRLGDPARKTVTVTVGPGTIQVAVEISITVTAARTTSRNIRRHIGIGLRLTTAVQQSQASGGELRCLTLLLNP